MPLLTYISGFLWGFALLASLAGWGLVVGRGLGKDDEVDWGLSVARGIAVLVALGGVINGLELISTATILTLVGVGLLVLAGGVLRPSPAGTQGWARLRACSLSVDGLSGAVAVVVVASYLNWLCFEGGSQSQDYSLNPSDDYQGYLVYPLRMLQTGTMGDDPFNDRRTSSALGGESFLQTFVLAVLPVEFIHVLDPGVANLAIAVMFYSMAPRRIAGALTLLYLAVPTNAANASAIALPLLLLLAIEREASRPRDGEPIWRTSARIALPLAAVLALKGTLIPGSVLIVGLGAVALAVETRSLRPLAVGLMAGVLALLLLLPWMIDQYPSSGSLLYPFLGEGYRAVSTYAMPHKVQPRPWNVLLVEILWILRTPRFACAVVVSTFAAITLYWNRSRSGEQEEGGPEHRASFLGTVIGSMATAGLFAIVFNLNQFYRYTYQYQTLLLLSGFRVLVAKQRASKLVSVFPRWGWERFGWAVAWATMAVLIVFGGARATAASRGWADSTRRWLAGVRVVEPDEAESYRRLQNALPPDAPVLCWMPKPFLLDFRRNPVFIHDMPGAVSPPPGLPLTGSSEMVQNYLRGTGLSYVVVSLPLDADIQPREWMRFVDYWLYSLDVNTSLWCRHLATLARWHQTVQPENGFLIIDLDRSRSTSDGSEQRLERIDDAWRDRRGGSATRRSTHH
jgi:hypothetical protein